MFYNLFVLRLFSTYRTYTIFFNLFAQYKYFWCTRYIKTSNMFIWNILYIRGNILPKIKFANKIILSIYNISEQDNNFWASQWETEYCWLMCFSRQDEVETSVSCWSGASGWSRQDVSTFSLPVPSGPAHTGPLPVPRPRPPAPPGPAPASQHPPPVWSTPPLTAGTGLFLVLVFRLTGTKSHFCSGSDSKIQVLSVLLITIGRADVTSQQQTQQRPFNVQFLWRAFRQLVRNQKVEQKKNRTSGSSVTSRWHHHDITMTSLK